MCKRRGVGEVDDVLCHMYTPLHALSGVFLVFKYHRGMLDILHLTLSPNTCVLMGFCVINLCPR